ncbi:MAG: NUDIX hydrolase [Candidatus Colwellbacteria bacterium]|nr:NUDIX hydrolase [Candidatus Colwellbacteria bacterium]
MARAKPVSRAGVRGGDGLFFEPSLAVDAVIFTVDAGLLQVLLIERANEPFAGMRALPGGFLKQGEGSAEAVRRILKDKAGVQGVYTEQLYTFDTPGRDPRGHVVSIAYYALVPRSELHCPRDAGGVSRFTAIARGTQIPALYPVRRLSRLAFDHREIVRYAAERLRAKIGYTNIVYSLLPPRFTLTELQLTYEAIFSVPLDRRNFQKKFLALGLIRPTGEYVRGKRQRPARLYEFISRKRVEIERPFS